jgi:hypothetical protein
MSEQAEVERRQYFARVTDLLIERSKEQQQSNQ